MRNGGRPIGSPSRGELVGTPRPGALDRDQHRHHPQELRAARVVPVVARDFRHQDPWPIAAEQSGPARRPARPGWRLRARRTAARPSARPRPRSSAASRRWTGSTSGSAPGRRCAVGRRRSERGQPRRGPRRDRRPSPTTSAAAAHPGFPSRAGGRRRSRPGRRAPPPPDTSRDRRGTCQAPWREAATRSARSRIAPGTHRSAGPCPATTASPPGRQGAARRRPRPSRR